MRGNDGGRDDLTRCRCPRRAGTVEHLLAKSTERSGQIEIQIVPLDQRRLEKITSRCFVLARAIVRPTFAASDVVESDSSVDDDWPPTLLMSPQIMGLLLV